MRINLEVDEAKAIANSLASTVEEKLRTHLANGMDGAAKDELITLISLKDRINIHIKRAER